MYAETLFTGFAGPRDCRRIPLLQKRTLAHDAPGILLEFLYSVLKHMPTRQSNKV